MSLRRWFAISPLVVILCGCSGSDEDQPLVQAPARSAPVASLAPTRAPSDDTEGEDGGTVDPSTDAGHVEVNENIFNAPKISVQPATSNGPAAPSSAGSLVALPTIQLVGFMAVDGSKALLKVDGKRIVSKIGDSFQNVEIIEVAAPKITFKLRGEEYTLDLTSNYRLDPNEAKREPQQTSVRPRPSRRLPESAPRPSAGAAKTPTAPVDVPQLPPLPGLGPGVALPPLPGGPGARSTPSTTPSLPVPQLAQ